MDVATLTGLRPHGTTLSSAFSAVGVDEFAPTLDSKIDLSYGRFAKIFTGRGDEPVRKEEHIAFLWNWLCYSLFCTWSLEMNRDFLPIVVALANSQKLALGSFFLASCIESCSSR